MELANKIQDAFDNIQAEPQLIESTKQFLTNERSRKRQTFVPAFRIALTAICMLVLLTAGIGGYTWAKTPVSYVSIDVNPSVELALNRFDRVVSATAYNIEGEAILKNLSLKGKKYNDAIDTIVESAAMKAYLTDQEELIITVAADGRQESRLISGVKGCAKHLSHNSSSVSVPIDTANQAHDHGVSVGKYYAWQQLNQYDETVTVDACRDMSISEIHELITEHEKEHEAEHENEDAHEENKEHAGDTHTEDDSHKAQEEHKEEEDLVEQNNHMEQENHVEQNNHIKQENHVEQNNHTEQENHADQNNHKEQETYNGQETLNEQERADGQDQPMKQKKSLEQKDHFTPKRHDKHGHK